MELLEAAHRFIVSALALAARPRLSTKSILENRSHFLAFAFPGALPVRPRWFFSEPNAAWLVFVQPANHRREHGRIVTQNIAKGIGAHPRVILHGSDAR